MSRIAKSPVPLPVGVEVKLAGRDITVKGSRGSLSLAIHNHVEVKQEDKVLYFSANTGGKAALAQAGTCVPW